jgi:F0F1-type ATP synthase delta subunit
MEPAALIANLQQVMQKRGHERLLPAVLRTILRERTTSRAERTIVRVVNEASYQEYQNEITATLATIGAGNNPQVTTDDSLIGGYQVEANYQRVDASYKQQLLSLYRNITTH